MLTNPPVLARCVVALTLTLCGSALASAISAADAAAAAAPACRPDPGQEQFTANLAFDEVPETAVIGGQTDAEVYIGHATATNEPDDATHIAVGPADPTPIARPYYTTYPSARTSDSDVFPTVPIQFERGDGPAVITLSMVHSGNREGGGYGPCRVTVTSGPIEPVEPSVSLNSKFPTIRDFDLYDTDDYSKSADFAFRTGLCGGERLKFVFRVSGAKRPYEVKSEPGCEWRTRTKRGPQGLIVRTEEDYGVKVTLRLPVRCELRRRVSYVIQFAGRRVKRGSFELRMRYEPAWPGGRIYETDFDEYWNTCIRGDYEIYSSGGRLYCHVPKEPAYRWATVHGLK